MTIPQNIQQLSQKLMLALKTIPELSITVTGNHINYTQTAVVTNSAPNSRKYHPYKKNTRSYTEIHLPELLKLALRENLMLTPISIPPNATIQQKLQLCLNEENTEYLPIYRYFHIGKTLYGWKLELTTANLTKEAIQKQLHNEFKTTAGSTNSHYRLRAALRLYDLFHTCENILQNPIFQPLKIQYIGKLTELKLNSNIIFLPERHSRLMQPKCCQIEVIEQEYYTDPQVLNQFIRGLKSSILGRVCSAHPNSLPEAIMLAKALELAEKKANHSQIVNMVMEKNKTETLEKRVTQLEKKLSKKIESYLIPDLRKNTYQSPQRCSQEEFRTETHVCHFCNCVGHLISQCQTQMMQKVHKNNYYSPPQMPRN
ncbi:hypothetical protein G9A89_017516 [Geosiphon pyriformis]|nr:hypothetical protein G9A89_017516 [Geosiphon pyriformis]